MWKNVRAVALEILRTQSPDSTSEDLDRIVLSTGYPWAMNSHDQTSHLLAVLAASLRNGGGPGPGYEAFSKMILAVVNDYISDNRLQQPLTMNKLAKSCAHYLLQPNVLPLAKKTEIPYLTELQALSNSVQVREGALIPQILNSIIEFSKVLVESFEGTATMYHQSFDKPIIEDQSGKFVLESFQYISHIPRVGVALGMNFFKDSQVPSRRNQSLQSLFENHIGWYIKPDIHVLRLMLKTTGRASVAGISDDQLTRLSESDVRKAYIKYDSLTLSTTMPYKLESDRPKVESAQWRCIEDVHMLARHIGIPPLEIDRLFFMIGSGRFYDGNRVDLSQEERYKRVMPFLGNLE